MKYLITLLLTLTTIFASSTCPSKAFKADYDERVELMSVLCHLAGYPEYNMNLGGKYIADVDSFFYEVKTHPAVEMMDSLRRYCGIGFDSPMAFAINLQNDNGKISMICDTIIPERRWNGVDLSDVTSRITDFYRDSKFHKFFTSHKKFYEQVCEVYDCNVISKFNQEWYEKFYGVEPTEKFKVIIGFVNGGGNYGPSCQLPNQPRDVYAIVGYALDEYGNYYYASEPMTFLNTLIHEFNHSFVNSLAEDPRFKTRMQQPAEKMFQLSKQIMRRSAYANWVNLVNESIVRAAVIRYLIDNNTPTDEIRQSIIDEMSVGFYWTPELVKCLSEYSENRDKYPSIEDFYPIIIEFFDKYAQKREDAIDDALE